MGNSNTKFNNINFEDMQWIINEKNNDNNQHYNTNRQKTIIISTLDIHNQECLIASTLNAYSEIEILNDNLQKNKDIRIIIYGMNSSDYSVFKKYEQLIKLGFYNIYIYPGGLFEWLLLQDIYGTELFSTTKNNIDLLKYKGRQQLNIKLLEG